jgi:selT/selW/selH-like putative selenoprotein
MGKISIAYCGTCNYRPIAAGLARAIEKETGVKSELVHSREIGAFEVTVNGDLIFSKKAAGRFPDFAKISGEVAGKIGKK